MLAPRTLPIDLGELHPAWRGWLLDRAGALVPPDTWRNGFAPHEIIALFYRLQELGPLRGERDRLRRELDHAGLALKEARKHRDFYRRQAHIASRWAWLLSPGP